MPSPWKLARRGCHVIAVGRTLGALEELDDEITALGTGGAATLLQLDLQDKDGIERMGAAIWERWGRLDGLVANAGILGDITPVGHMERKVWDRLIAVNLTANWRLIRSLDPTLRQSDSARAVFLTASAARLSPPFWGGYAATKAGLEALVKTYAVETETVSSVRANLFDPGIVRTHLRAQAAPGEDPSGLTKPSEVAPAIADLVSPACDRTGGLYCYPDGWSEPG